MFLKFLQKFEIVAVKNSEMELVSFLIQTKWKYNFNARCNSSGGILFLGLQTLFSSGKALNDKPHKDIIPFPINNWESTGEKFH